MTSFRDSMVDVESPQQALQAYSGAKEYACCILCDARCGDSNIGESRPPSRRERQTIPRSAPPYRRHRDNCASEPLASKGAYPRSERTPPRDESHAGHNPISTLRDLLLVTYRSFRSQCSLRANFDVRGHLALTGRQSCGEFAQEFLREPFFGLCRRLPLRRPQPGSLEVRMNVRIPGKPESAV